LKVRGIRGAIAVEVADREATLAATERLLAEMISRNDLDRDDIASIVFTATPDLNTAFPAEAARQMGMGAIPLLCAQEIDVRGAMARVVRILMHVNTDRMPAEIVHVYLDGAESLRDDL
jgi:chorismate mutase